MNFFNKYKDLFGVADGTPFPKTRLSIDNNIIIDKPYVPTYKESYNLNSKLKQLKKDYDNFELQVNEITRTTPKRASSRKGTPVKKQKTNLLQKKRGDWLLDQQKNLMKHSQMDYLFKEKLKKQYPRFDSLPETTIPKMNNIFSNGQEAEEYKFKIRNKSKFQGEVKPPRTKHRQQEPQFHTLDAPKSTSNKSSALRKRQEAKNNLATRRHKLGILLKTSW